ncbi:amidohydrolase family protein [Metabacillus malikii]|uniref:TIM-barrel fold metal-dependent hydrolase n=1 Tax=Metabacillus malikii TaxID=1504265 RepID=A0ABT9Z9Y6_9BACI|nr:amidohydrolase family protein [Metabacillus malikii]MDQ0229063.1 putative TIM-barrel fold metal-dependent hydrolase [Metabacillus malikii]
MVIDSHVHISNEKYSNLETLEAAMKDANIDKAVLVPGGMIDVRKMTKYITGKEQPEQMEPPNDIVKEIITKYPDKYKGFFVVNPNKGADDCLEKIEQYKIDGFSGLKFSPVVYQFSLLGKVSKAIVEHCGNLNLPVYTHTLFHPSANVASAAALAKEFPNTTVIIGHFGFGPADVEAMQYAKELDNLYLETSTANYLALKEAIGICGSEKMLFGSEFPLSDPCVEKLKIERLPISDKERENIFLNNITNILRKE